MGSARNLNDLFGELDKRGIAVISLRNKANRLEELFMRLVENKQDGSEVATVRVNIMHSTPSRFKTLIRKEIIRVMRIWIQTIVPPAITMTLYFIIFGNLIGRRIGQMDGFDYMQYIAPGLIMMSVITNSYGNVVSSFFGAKFGRHPRGDAGIADVEFRDYHRSCRGRRDSRPVRRRAGHRHRAVLYATLMSRIPS